MSDDEIRAARAARKAEKAASKADAARRREERAAEPPPDAREIVRNPADAELFALLLDREVLCDHLYRRLMEGPHHTTGTALQAVLICEAIFGPRER